MVGIAIDVAGTPAVRQRLAELRQQGFAPLLDALGTLGESQTRRRLGQDKEGPQGEPWPDWSPGYAKTRRGGHQLLESEGLLIDSIHYMVHGDQVQVGSGLVYAAIHHFGGADAGKPEIPARPWLGVSDEDVGEIRDTLADWLGFGGAG